jgi:hypothetical protein
MGFEVACCAGNTCAAGAREVKEAASLNNWKKSLFLIPGLSTGVLLENASLLMWFMKYTCVCYSL